MRYDLTDFEWSIIEPLLPKDRRGRKPRNNRRVQRYLLGVAHGRAVARFAGAIWAVHERLQSLQPLAQGRHLGSPDGCHRQGARRQGADGRQLYCIRVHQHASRVKKRVVIAVWAEAEEASPRRSTRGSMRRAGRSAS